MADNKEQIFQNEQNNQKNKNGKDIAPQTGAQAIAKVVIDQPIEDEMKVSYIDYAMSVIIGRAIPDTKDGLKPVQRRILYGMYNMGLTHDKPFRKSARVVGDVLGKYHPHGDMAVYDALVRMAQDFSLRYPLIDGQGNFGSIDGDPPAAMRYTECRLTKIAEELLFDIDKETVEFVDNFDGSEKEPVVLPGKLPNLLVNGSSGIAVGMATNIPPHNLREIVDGLVLLIEKPNAEIKEILEVIKGPDFPTGGIIYGYNGIYEAYTTGRGTIKVRAKTHIEEAPNDRERIVVTEIPYQVNKTKLLETIASLVKDKRIEGISDIRDESDREGMRIVIDLKKDALAEVVLNQLFIHTQLQTSFGIINLALVNNKPEILTIKGLLNAYLEHRKCVVRKRTEYELKKALQKAHILEGLLVAIDHIDEVISIIRASKSTDEARAALSARFSLSDEQTKAILDMRLGKLTGLERESVKADYEETLKLIENLKKILSSEHEILSIIKTELLELKEKYGDDRRTVIEKEGLDLTIEDLIADELVVVTTTNSGYIKRQPLNAYKAQRRGGKGLVGMETKEEDSITNIFVTMTHDTLMFFTNKGKVYWLRAYQIPEGSRHSKGKAIVNLLPQLEKDEVVNAVIPVRNFDDTHYLVFATCKGLVKKTVLSAYGNIRSTGIIAMRLEEGDSIVDVRMTDGDMDIILATRLGQACRFYESDVRPMGRNTFGVKGVTLCEGDEVVSMAVVKHEETADEEVENGENAETEEDEDVEEITAKGKMLLTVTENGYGKRSPFESYRKTRRGAKGVITIKSNERNGPVVALLEVDEDDELIITSASGMVIRTPVSQIPIHGRNTQGVRIMKLNEKDKVIAVERVIPLEAEEKVIEEAEKAITEELKENPVKTPSPEEVVQASLQVSLSNGKEDNDDLEGNDDSGLDS